MKHLKRTLAMILALVLMATSVAACGRKAEDVSEDVKETATATPEATPDAGDDSEEVEADKVFGTVNGTTYTNEYFKFTMEFPADWHVSSREELLQVNQLGAQVEQSGTSKEVIDLTMQQIVPLFMISKYGISSQEADNATMNAQALNLGILVSQFKSPKDYLDLAIEGVKAQGIEMNTGEVTELKLGGHDFATVESTRTIAGLETKQSMYATFIDKYIVLFTMGYLDDAGKQTLVEVMNSIKFQ